MVIPLLESYILLMKRLEVQIII